MFIFIDDSLLDIKNETCIWGYGSLWVPDSCFKEIENLILDLRIENNCWKEFKWNDIDKNHLSYYKKLIDIAITKRVKFNSIVGQKAEASMIKLLHGNKTNFVSKMIWQLILQNYKSYKESNKHIEDLTIIMDKDILPGRGECKDNFINSLKTMGVNICKVTNATSHIVGCLQVADLLTGVAISEATTSKNRNEYQNELYKHVSQYGKIQPNLFENRSWSKKFNNWFFQPSIKSKGNSLIFSSKKL
jgi:hypothetical protein